MKAYVRPTIRAKRVWSIGAGADGAIGVCTEGGRGRSQDVRRWGRIVSGRACLCQLRDDEPVNRDRLAGQFCGVLQVGRTQSSGQFGQFASLEIGGLRISRRGTEGGCPPASESNNGGLPEIRSELDGFALENMGKGRMAITEEERTLSAFRCRTFRLSVSFPADSALEREIPLCPARRFFLPSHFLREENPDTGQVNSAMGVYASSEWPGG